MAWVFCWERRAWGWWWHVINGKRKGVRFDGSIGLRIVDPAYLSPEGASEVGVVGVGIGSLSALVELPRHFLGMAGELPGKEFAWFFLLLLGLGIFWTWLSVSLNLRTSRLKLLNDE